VQGIVVPVRTSTSKQQRGTADVEGRDLALMPEDRGHLMALSLGAPDDSVIMVNQPRFRNQSLAKGGSETASSSQLTWRGMEIYALWCALRGFNRNDVPVANESVSIEKAGRGFKVNGNYLVVPEPVSYHAAHALEPAFRIAYTATVSYPQANRGNSPSNIRVSLDLVRRGQQTLRLLENRYHMQHTVSEELNLWARRQARLREKRQRLRRAVIRNGLRLRNRVRPMPDWHIYK
jgi:hypothetical protein